MTLTFGDNKQSFNAKSEQPLTRLQKLLFGMVCWGIQSWSQAQSFKINGYHRKYKDARNSMYTGLAIYGLSFTLFIVLLSIF